MVQDISRPDVNGNLPKMNDIANAAKEVLKDLGIPVLRVHTDDNFLSTVDITGSFDPKESWANGIFQNSRYFRFSIQPQNGKRYYDPTDEKVVAELPSGSRSKTKFRKYTASVDKVLAKIAIWLQENK